MGLSLIGTPGRWDLEDPAALHTLVATELLGASLDEPEAPRAE